MVFIKSCKFMPFWKKHKDGTDFCAYGLTLSSHINEGRRYPRVPPARKEG